MTISQSGFAPREYENRVSRTRTAMRARGLECLIVSDPSNMAWLTGYNGWSFYVHQAVVLGPSGAPLWWGRAMDALGARRTVFMGQENIHGYDDTYVQNPDKHPMEDLSRLIAASGWGDARIGVEMDNYYFSAAAYQCLQQGLAKVRFEDATGLVNWQRAVKSDAEIAYMRKAARIVENMHAVIAEKATPGMAKNALVAEIYHAAIGGVDDAWGDYPAIVPLTPSGANATAPHLTWDDSPLKKGEANFFEVAGVYRRYHCPQSRTLFLGAAPQKYLDAEKAVLEAVAAGMEQIKPGNLCEDVARAFNGTLNRLGFEKDSRCGYAIGLSYPPDWGERTMSFRAGDRSVLQAGMTFHFMPALWLDDGGIEITEPVLVTKSGAEYLCNTPRGLLIKGRA